MNGELILKAMTDINDRFIAEAADEEHIKAVFCTEQENVTPSDKQKNTRVKFRRILLVAVISALVLIAAAVAVTSFVGDALSVLKNFDDRIVGMFEGDKTEFQGITIIKGGEVNDFDSVEEAMESTGLQFLYPTVWPEGVELDNIRINGDMDENFNYTDEYLSISFITNISDSVSIMVHTHPNANKGFLTSENCIKKTIADYECYFADAKQYIQCYFTYNNYVYEISAATYEDAVTIVEGMRE